MTWFIMRDDDGVLADLVSLFLGARPDGLLQVADHVVDVGLRSAELVDRGDQIALGGDDRPDLLARDDADVVDREDVGRVGHRDDEFVVLDA